MNLVSGSSGGVLQKELAHGRGTSCGSEWGVTLSPSGCHDFSHGLGMSRESALGILYVFNFEF